MRSSHTRYHRVLNWHEIVALLLLEAFAAAAAQAPPLALAGPPEGALGHALIHNATTSPIRYRSWHKGAKEQAGAYKLDSGEYHLWREAKDLIVAHGDP